MRVVLLDHRSFDTGYDAEWLYATWDAARKNQITCHLHLVGERVNILLLDGHATFSEVIIGNFPTIPPKP